MNLLLFGVGIFCILIISIDLILTTIQVNGAGFISGGMAAFIWWLLRKLCGDNSRCKLLNFSGVIIVLGIIGTWIFGLWLGYLLLYLADEGSIVAASTKVPTDFWGKVYYSGFTLSTLGIGDMVPTSNLYRVITSLNSLTGLFFITLSITYMVPVLGAVIFKRQLASLINTLGNSPVDILRNGWDGKSISHLDPFLQQLCDMILLYSENHLAYPVLHYFHRNDPKFSAPLNLARLDEAVGIALYILPKETVSNPLLLRTLRGAMDEYLNTLKSAFVKPAKDIPPADYEKDLVDLFPQYETSSLDDYFSEHEDRRKLLHQLVLVDGWSWEMVRSPAP